jgi:hypothetical protein
VAHFCAIDLETIFILFCPFILNFSHLWRPPVSPDYSCCRASLALERKFSGDATPDLPRIVTAHDSRRCGRNGDREIRLVNERDNPSRGPKSGRLRRSRNLLIWIGMAIHKNVHWIALRAWHCHICGSVPLLWQVRNTCQEGTRGYFSTRDVYLRYQTPSAEPYSYP